MKLDIKHFLRGGGSLKLIAMVNTDEIITPTGFSSYQQLKHVGVIQ